MCLAIPGKVVEIQEVDDLLMAKASFGGVVKQVCLQYTPDVQVGDYVLVHVGFALNKIDEAEAEETFRALEQLGQLDELYNPEDQEELIRQVKGGTHEIS